MKNRHIKRFSLTWSSTCIWIEIKKTKIEKIVTMLYGLNGHSFSTIHVLSNGCG